MDVQSRSVERSVCFTDLDFPSVSVRVEIVTCEMEDKMKIDETTKRSVDEKMSHRRDTNSLSRTHHVEVQLSD